MGGRWGLEFMEVDDLERIEFYFFCVFGVELDLV